MLVPDTVRDAHPGHRAGYVADPRPRPMGAGWNWPAAAGTGLTFPAEISLSAIDTDEGILVTAVVRDVTERLEIQAERERLRAQTERDRMERQLHQSQRLESLGQLAGGVAHDFNNLLGVISNYSSFVGDEVARELPSRRWQAVHDDIGQVEQAAQRAADLTHQLLAFARQEVIQPRVLDLNEVVTSSSNAYPCPRRARQLVSDLAEDLESVLADPGQLEQVLVNLAVNARDAMPGGGKLIIQTTNTDLGRARGRAGPPGTRPVRGGQGQRHRDRDPQRRRGPGIRAVLLHQAEGRGNRPRAGHRLRDHHPAGGNVRIYSEPGLGTVFTILLPVTVLAAAAGAARPAAARPGATVPWSGCPPCATSPPVLDRNGYHVAAASAHDAPQSGPAAGPRPAATDVLLPR